MFKYTNISKPFSVRPPHGGVNWIEIPAVDVQALRVRYDPISYLPLWLHCQKTTEVTDD